MISIILDPAHGQEVPGKRSPDEYHREYLWSRQRCNSLAWKLTCLGYDVLFTNVGYTEIGVGKRKRIAELIAEDFGNTLLISIHNDAFGNEWTNAHGYSVYTTKGNTKSDSFAEILMKEFKKEFPELSERVDLSDNDLDKEENFTVLTGSNYFAVLIEWLFQNNRKEVALINCPTYIEKFENCIINAITQWS